MTDHPSDEPIGGAVEEAVRLFGALGDWARQHVGGFDEHLATGAPECAYCPVCRTVHVLRLASPEVLTHLATAASALMQAAGSVLAAAATSGPRSTRTPSVEKIDLDTDESWPDERPDAGLDVRPGQESEE